MSRAGKALIKLLDRNQDANWADMDEIDSVLRNLGYGALIRGTKGGSHGRWKHPKYPDANCNACENHKSNGSGGIKKVYIQQIRNNVKYLINVDERLSEYRNELRKELDQ